MAKLRNINTGVVISFDDAMVDRFSAAEWESIGGARTVAKKAAPAKSGATKRGATKKTASKKAAAKKATPVAAAPPVAAVVANAD